MPEIARVIEEIRQDNSIYDAANERTLTFVNRNNQPLLGAQILPDVQQDNNLYATSEQGFLDVVADDADRYSPPRFKGAAARVAAMEVALGEMNIGQQLWAAQYDRLVALVSSATTLEQMARIILDFVGAMGRGMASKSEIQRWQAMIAGAVVRRINRSRSLIRYPTIPGQRAALVAAWSDPATDPMLTFEAAEDYGAEQGYSGIARIVTSSHGQRTLNRNPHIKNYVYGDAVVRRVSGADVQQFLADEGFPRIETYDTLWYDEGGLSGRYFPEDAIAFFYNVGGFSDDLATFSEENPRVFVPAEALTGGAVIGHNGIGTPGGESTPGRAVDVYEPQGRPKRVLGEGVQTSLPVLDHPHACFVRTAIR